MKSAALTMQHSPRMRAATTGPERYASAAATKAVLARGQAARLERLNSLDMVNTDRAAALAGTTRATIKAWIEKGRCIGLQRTTRGYRLPAWQFEPHVLVPLAAISAAMGTVDGWALLSFLETPLGGLDGRTPRQALEQGMSDRVIALAGDH